MSCLSLLRAVLLVIAMSAIAENAMAWACADEPPATMAAKLVPRNAALRVHFKEPFQKFLAREVTIEGASRRIAVRVTTLPRQQLLVSPVTQLAATPSVGG